MVSLNARGPRLAACAAISLGIAAGGRVLADHVQQSPPPVGQVATFAITGDAEATVSMEGADAGIPLDVQTDVSVQRRVTAVSKDGAVTVEQTVPRHDMSVNGQSYQSGDLPTTTTTTDASGKVITEAQSGHASSAVAGISAVQSALETWQLPNKDFKSGDTWSEPVGFSSDAAAKDGARLQHTYAGLKQLDGHSVMEFTTRLTRPIQMALPAMKAMSGFKLAGMQVASVDQKSDYDPVTGLLQRASTSLDLSVKGAMGEGDSAMPVTIHMPLTLRTRLEKVAVDGAGPENKTEGTPGAPVPTPPHQTP